MGPVPARWQRRLPYTLAAWLLQVEATLKAAGAEVELFTYPGVGHAFLNASPAPHASFEARKEKQGFPPYDDSQAQLAWARIQEFFKKHILA